MSSPPKQRGQSLADLFSTLSINSSNSASTSTNLLKTNLAESLRQTMDKRFPHWGSCRKGTRATFSLVMDAHYDYYSLGEIDEDPDDLFEKTLGCFEEVQDIFESLNDQQAAAYDSYITETLSAMVFGSNNIEKVGATRDISLKLCQEVLTGVQVPSELPERDHEYANIKQFLISQNKTCDHEAIIHTWREIVQHAQALKFLLTHIVISNESLSEDLILQTHKILCDDISLDDGDSSSTYAGIYRTVHVSAGFSTFTSPDRVAGAMKSFVRSFNDDISQAEEEGKIDPFALAAKYCHKFVNIHPFVDGNGRTCRLILNAVLLKYAGVVVVLGETEEERETYLGVASRASEMEQIEEEERGGKPAWAELSSLVIMEACKAFESLRDSLRGRVSVGGAELSGD